MRRWRALDQARIRYREEAVDVAPLLELAHVAATREAAWADPTEKE